MKLVTLKIFTLIVYLLTSKYSYATDVPNIKNLVFHKETKKIGKIEFKNSNNNIENLSSYKNKLILLNFWATWCAPCREEMPSLDKLKSNNKFKNLKIFAINVGNEELKKSIIFYKNYNIKNLEIYFDDLSNLPNEFLLRGLPTTILINKNNEEFARIIGSMDFQNKKFINWLKKYD